MDICELPLVPDGPLPLVAGESPSDFCQAGKPDLRRVAGDVCELPLVLGGPLPLVARQLVEGRSTWFLSSWKALSVRLESLTYVPTHAGTGVFDHLAASRRAVLCVLYVLFVLLEPTFH